MSFLGKIGEWFESFTTHDDHHSVVVRKGDSLWKIAEELTGDGMNWQKIADANPDKHWTKDYVIQPGEVLNLPKD